MPYRLHNSGTRLSRSAAWLLAALLLWMGTGGVLQHTDDGPIFASASAKAALGHVTPAAPADDCAACQWTQGMQSGTFSVCRVALPLSFTVAHSAPVARRFLSRPLRLRSSRAPPVFLS